MTIAVCIKCGQPKFGAFTACKNCSFEPSKVIELAKSLYLSDHNFPKSRLDAFGLTIGVGEPVEYDPIALTVIAQPIFHEQYRKSRQDSSGYLPCICCGTVFLSHDDSATCRNCERALNAPIFTCTPCELAFEEGISCCSRCGQPVKKLGTASPTTIARAAAFHTSLLKANQKLLESSNYLARTVNKLPSFDKARYEQELEILALYATILMLRDVMISSAVYDIVLHEVLQIFYDCFLLYGLTRPESEARMQRYLEQIKKYDEAIAKNSGQPMLGLALDAANKLFPNENRPELPLDLVVLIGAYLKYSRELLFKSAFGTSF